MHCKALVMIQHMLPYKLKKNNHTTDFLYFNHSATCEKLGSGKGNEISTNFHTSTSLWRWGSGRSWCWLSWCQFSCPGWYTAPWCRETRSGNRRHTCSPGRHCLLSGFHLISCLFSAPCSDLSLNRMPTLHHGARIVSILFSFLQTFLRFGH